MMPGGVVMVPAVVMARPCVGGACDQAKHRHGEKRSHGKSVDV
jgi:hypothetical protein